MSVEDLSAIFFMMEQNDLLNPTRLLTGMADKLL